MQEAAQDDHQRGAFQWTLDDEIDRAVTDTAPQDADQLGSLTREGWRALQLARERAASPGLRFKA